MSYHTSVGAHLLWASVRPIALIPVLLLIANPPAGVGQERAVERRAGAAEAIAVAVDHMRLEWYGAEGPFVLLPLAPADRKIAAVGPELSAAARLLGVEAMPDRTGYDCTENIPQMRASCVYRDGRPSVLAALDDIEMGRAKVRVSMLVLGEGPLPIAEERFYVVGSVMWASVHLTRSTGGAWVVSEVTEEMSGLVVDEVGKPR